MTDFLSQEQKDQLMHLFSQAEEIKAMELQNEQAAKQK